MGHTLIVDTGPLMEGFGPPEGSRALVPQGVLEECLRHGVTENELASRHIATSEATAGAVARVDAAAERTGDAGVLSPADIELLALALDLDGEVGGDPVTLITDDYAVQNVAATLGVATRAFGQRGIQRQLTWEWYCAACRSHVGTEAGECPVCGSGLKRRPASGRSARRR